MKPFSVFLKAAFALFLSLSLTPFVHAASIDPSFATDGGFTYQEYSGSANFIKVLDDGKILVGGGFDRFNGLEVSPGLMRFNADLTVDTSFDVGEGFDAGNVRSVIIQDDGKMLVTGVFELFQGEAAHGILRLNADGSLDETFDPSTGGSNTGGIHDVVALDGGDYLIAFGSNGATYRGEQARGLRRINGDGSLDNSFGLDEKFEYLYAGVEDFSIQPDGKILAAGSFYYKGLDGESDGPESCEEGDGECEVDLTQDDESYRFMRFNADGTVDETFANNPDFEASVSTIVLLGSGKMYIGGQFSSYEGTSVPGIARLNADGTLDETFAPTEQHGGTVYSILVQDDDKVIIGGQFSSYGDREYLSLMRFNADGSVDENFDTRIVGGSFSSTIYDMALLDDGRLLVGGSIGDFEFGDISYNTGGLIAYFIEPRVLFGPYKLSMREGDEAGEWDNKHYLVLALNSKPSAPVTIELSSLNDQLSFSTSTFTFYPSDWTDPSWEGYVPYYGTIVTAVDDSQIEANHSDEVEFSVSSSDDDYGDIDVANIPVFIADNDSSLLLDQTFRPTGIDGSVRATAVLPDDKLVIVGGFSGGIRRINTDATEDVSFDIGTGFNAQVNDVHRLSDGDLLVVGEFTQFDGEDIRRIARLNADGSLDTGFDAGTGFDDTADKLFVGSDGKIIVIGGFESFDGEDAYHIARLNADGSLDTSFVIGDSFSGNVSSVIVQSSGKLIVAGDFSQYNGESVPLGLVGLNVDGSIDTAFTSNLGTGSDNTIRFIARQPDGKIIVSGNFEEFNGEPALTIFRLNSDGTRDNTFVSSEYSYDEQTNDEHKFGLNGTVYDVIFLPDGQMLVAGDFTYYYGNDDESEEDDIPSGLLILNSDGTPDLDFGQVDKYAEVTSLAVLSDGSIIMSTTASGARSLQKVSPVGVTDTDFSVWGGYGVGYPPAIQVKSLSDGSYLVVGSFNGSYTQSLIKVNSDGSPDDSFSLDPVVTGVAGFFLDANEKIVVYGNFGMVRLNLDGSLDESFEADEDLELDDNNVSGAVPYDEDTILVAVNERLYRIFNDGSLDDSFYLDDAVQNTGAGGDSGITVDHDGSILISGEVVYNNESGELVRLNPDGSLARNISGGLGFYRFTLHHIGIQSDGKKIVTGLFRRTQSSGTQNLIRLNADDTLDVRFGMRVINDQVNVVKVQEDDSVIMGGYFGSYSTAVNAQGQTIDSYGAQRIMRMHPDGDIDLSFPTGSEPGGFGDIVYDLDIDQDNKIIVVGQMQTFRGVRVQNVARLIETSIPGNEDDLDTESPVISGISVTANSSNEVRISWSTNEVASARIYYGLTSSYGSQTDEFDTNPRSVNHATVINNLAACTTYHYKVLSEDASDNLAASSDGTFMTLGCPSSSSSGSSRRSSVGVSAPTSQSVPLVGASLGAGGLTIEQIISLITQFISGPTATTQPSSSVGSTVSTVQTPAVKALATRVGGSRRNLTVGSSGQDVRDLQQFLINQGKGSSTQALAQVGDTGYFGSLTRGALAEYQAANGIAPAIGYFGPVTRTKVSTLGQ